MAYSVKITASGEVLILRQTKNKKASSVDNGSSSERRKMKALKLDQNMERRIEKRHACSEAIFFATQKRLYDGRLKDYSRNGLFIRTRENLALGEIITVVDPHPDGENIKRKGQIRWKNKEGFGVELYRRRNLSENNVIHFDKRALH